jgi:phosphatidylserine synthase 2
MGQHTWLLLATIGTEFLAIRKWSRGMFKEPFPFYVKLGWSIGAVVLTVYPIYCVSRDPPSTTSDKI